MPRSGDEYSLPAGTAAVASGLANSSHINSRFNDLATEQNLVRPISAGGTGAANPSAARTALGLAIGTNVQAYDALLQALAALVTSADKGLHFTGADTVALHDQTAFARTLLDDADAAAMRTTLGLGALALLAEITTSHIAAAALRVVADGYSTPLDTELASAAWVQGYAAQGIGMIGYGQTWQNVEPSRLGNTSYQNTTGRPIMVFITTNQTGGFPQVSVDNSTWVNVGRFDAGTTFNAQFIVPNNHYYRLNIAKGSVTFWTELR